MRSRILAATAILGLVLASCSRTEERRETGYAPCCSELGGRAVCGMYVFGGFNYVDPPLVVSIALWDDGSIVKGAVAENGIPRYMRGKLTRGACAEIQARLRSTLTRMQKRGYAELDSGFTKVFCAGLNGLECAISVGGHMYSDHPAVRQQFARDWDELVQCLNAAAADDWSEFRGELTIR